MVKTRGQDSKDFGSLDIPDMQDGVPESKPMSKPFKVGASGPGLNPDFSLNEK